METSSRRPAILAIGTALPDDSGSQSEIAEWMAASFVDRPAQARMIRTLCTYSGIETRYSCTSNYRMPPQESRLAPGAPAERSLSTAERMAIYEQEAAPLGAKAARAALAAHAATLGVTPEVLAASVTHLIVVSCTGFFAPGVDFVIAQQLNLASTVKRSLIGFMGCSATFNGLRAAHDTVSASPDALALVVSVELCSLHTSPNPGREQLIGYSLFADGASACLVGLPETTAPGAVGDYFALGQFHTNIKPNTEEVMAWRIGNYGFELRLSPRVPEHLADVAPAALADLFGEGRPEFWAIHPGGRAIVDRLADVYGLDDTQVAASRAVLRDYGNLSSATILFVLAELQCSLRQNTSAPAQRRELDGVAMAFGPGLVLEMARLTYVPGTTGSAATQALPAAVAAAD